MSFSKGSRVVYREIVGEVLEDNYLGVKIQTDDEETVFVKGADRVSIQLEALSPKEPAMVKMVAPTPRFIPPMSSMRDSVRRAVSNPNSRHTQKGWHSECARKAGLIAAEHKRQDLAELAEYVAKKNASR